MRMWMFGCSFMNLVTMSFRATYSAPWLAGGGGVYPIHITRFTWPFDPLPDPEPLLPEEHAAMSRVRMTATDTPKRFIGHLTTGSARRQVRGSGTHSIPLYGLPFCT